MLRRTLLASVAWGPFMATSNVATIALHGSSTTNNVAPVFVAGPTISGSVVEGMVLTVSYSALGTPVPSATYQWKSNGSNVGSNAATYATVSGDIGNTITCQVTLTNGVGSPAVATSPATSPIQAPPVAPSFVSGPTVTGVTSAGNTLTVNYVAAGNPVPTATFQWKSGGVNVGSSVNTYNTLSGDVGNTITCTVTLTNGVGSPAVSTSPAVGPITTGNQAPAFAVGGNPAVTGSLVQGNQLSVTYSATGSPTPTPAYQWKSNGSNVGSNASTYTTVAGDVGHTITCQITLTNGVGSPAVATSPAVGPVTAATNAPAFTSGPSVTGSVIQGNTLTVSYTATGAPTPTPAYQWKSNGTNVGTNATTYATVIGDVGHTITCTVTLTNGVGSPAVATSAATSPIQSASGSSNPTSVVIALPDNTTSMTITNYTFDALGGTATDIGSYVDPSGRFTMTCKRITSSPPGCPIFVDYRTIAAQNWACFVFSYSDFAAPSTVQNLRGYVATFAGGATVTTPGHWAQARWRQCFLNGVAGTGQACWPFALTSTSSLVSNGYIPPADASLVNGTQGSLPTGSYTPMTYAGISGDMPATGARADIGPVTGWTVQYMANGAPNQSGMLSTILAQAEGMAGWPFFFTDHNTNAVADCIYTYSNATVWDGNQRGTPEIYAGSTAGTFSMTIAGPAGTVVTGNGSGGPTYRIDSTHTVLWYGSVTIPMIGAITIKVTNGEALTNYDPGAVSVNTYDSNGNPVNSYPGVTFTTVANSFVPGCLMGLDAAHMPCCAYIPFLLTGDPYFLELMQANAMYAYAADGRFYYGLPGGNQMRELSWCLRAIFHAALTTPSSVPSWLVPQSTFTKGLSDYLGNLTNLLSQPGFVNSVAHTAYPPWQDSISGWQMDYFALVVSWISRSFPAWASTRTLVVDQYNHRLNPSGNGVNDWCGTQPIWYYGSGAQSVTTWAQFWQKGLGGPYYDGNACWPSLNAFLSSPNTVSDYTTITMMSLRFAKWAGDTTTAGALAYAAPVVAANTGPGLNMYCPWEHAYSG